MTSQLSARFFPLPGGPGRSEHRRPIQRTLGASTAASTLPPAPGGLPPEVPVGLGVGAAHIQEVRPPLFLVPLCPGCAGCPFGQ